MNDELVMNPLDSWAKRAVEKGEASGMTLGRHGDSGAEGSGVWEAHGFPVDETRLDEFKSRAGPLFKSKTLARVEDIPIAELVSMQGGVWREKVEDMVTHEHFEPEGARDADGYLVDFPRVIRCDGTLWLYDGNHRLEASRRRGLTTAPARVVDLDALEHRSA